MTLKEIAQRLQETFPERSVCFGCDAWSHYNKDQAKYHQSYSLRLFDCGLNQAVEGESLDECIVKMQKLIDGTLVETSNFVVDPVKPAPATSTTENQ